MFIYALNYEILTRGRKGNKCVARVEVSEELKVCEIFVGKCDVMVVRSDEVPIWIFELDKREVQERIRVAMEPGCDWTELIFACL